MTAMVQISEGYFESLLIHIFNYQGIRQHIESSSGSAVENIYYL